MKKILIVHHTGELGGGTKSLIDIALMLNNEYEVIVCIPEGFNDFVKILSEKNIKFVELNARIPFLSGYSGNPPFISKETIKSFFSIIKIKKFCSAIMQYEPDIVIFNTIVTSVSAKYLPTNVIKICIDRETMVNPISKIRYQNLLNKYIDGVTFLAEFERSKFKLKNIKTAIIPDSVPNEDISYIKEYNSEYQLPKNKFIILYMGGSSLIKGPDTMLRAFNMLNDDFYLIVAGKFNPKIISIKSIIKHIITPAVMLRQISLRKAYLKAINRKNILFAGSVGSIYGLINSSDIIVFPSYNVHQPRPCIEAGYFGKPVIISDYPETKEYFKDGYNALTFRPKNYKDLAKKLIFSKRNLDEIKKIGTNNRAMSLEKHDFNKIQNIFCKFIKDMILSKESKSEILDKENSN